MVPEMIEHTQEERPILSRRKLLKNSATFAALAAVIKPLRGAATDGHKVLAYVASDEDQSGKGIFLYEMNPATGELILIKLAAELRHASWLALDPSGRFLYAAQEVGGSEGKSGSVMAYAVNRANGDLQPLNSVQSEGAGPAHLSVDASGKYVFVANYAGGSIAVLPIRSSGALGHATYVHKDTGSVGPQTAASAPPGSFAISGHDAPHAHMIQADPGNRFVLQTDLGQDRIYVYAFDPGTGKFAPAQTPYVQLPPGDGPRHFAFHSNGRWLYSLQEESSTIVFFHFEPRTGSLHAEQSLSSLPPGFKGTSFSSEILLSADGRFVYAANRLNDTIAIFSLDGEGKLHYAGAASTMGDYPRHTAFAPGGNFFYACNQRSDNITVFKCNKKTGLLTLTGQYFAVGSPACIVFLN